MPKLPTAARGRRIATPPPLLMARRGFHFGVPRRLAAPGGADPPRPKISARLAIVLASSIAGLGIATYLTLAHYTTIVPLTCPNSGAISCFAVTTSAESVLFGIPVAVLGLPFFVAMIVFSLPAVWRSRSPLVAPARLVLAVAGIGFVCYLLYAELYEVGKVCLWCTGVHVLTLVIFVAVVTGWDETTAFAREVVADS